MVRRLGNGERCSYRGLAGDDFIATPQLPQTIYIAGLPHALRWQCSHVYLTLVFCERDFLGNSPYRMSISSSRQARSNWPSGSI
jgi:hypothetical protein